MIRETHSWRLLFMLGSGLVLGLAAPSGDVPAQQSATLPVAPGTRVRVRSSTLVAPLVANFMQMRGDTAVFIEDAAGRGIWSLVVSDISRLELSDGERRRNRGPIVRGATYGGIAGVVVGFAFAAIASPSDSTKKFSRPLNATVGALLGGGIGGVVGSRVGMERWTEVSLPRRISLTPNRRGIALSLAF